MCSWAQSSVHFSSLCCLLSLVTSSSPMAFDVICKLVIPNFISLGLRVPLNLRYLHLTAAQRYHPGVQHIISDLKYPEQRLDFTPDLLLPVFRSQHHQVKDLFLLHISHPVHQQVCSFYLQNILQSYFLPHCHLSPGFPLSLI